MKKILLTPNPYRDCDFSAAAQAAELLRAQGVETVCFLPFLPEGVPLPPLPAPQVELEDALEDVDMVICFGGDGTILHMAKNAALHNKPILGVNMGSMGFIADMEVPDLPLLAGLPAGKYRTEARMMLDVSVLRHGQQVFHELALNDAVLTKGSVVRVLDLSVAADNIEMMHFRGDGIIVCTPTGSTAYSMSAGGPIIEPTSRNILITPICAHTILARPFVLNGESCVSIRVPALGRKAVHLSVDGGADFPLGAEDELRIRRAALETTLVRIRNRSFYETVNQKLCET